MATRNSRTRDRHKRTRKLVEAKKNRGKNTEKGTKYTWSLDETETEEVFRDLDVSLLRWPDEDVRDSSQEIFARGVTDKSTSNALKHKIAASSSVQEKKVRSTRTCGVCPTNRHSAVCSKPTGSTDEKYDPFTNLSDEIILVIFEFLSRHTLCICAQVCKDWQILAYDECLWKGVDMTKAKLSAGVLGSVLLRGTRVLRIAMSKVCSPIFDEGFTIFPDIAPVLQKSSDCLLKLSHLDATLCSFEEDSLLCLLMHSKRLKCLSLDSCSLSLSILRAIGDCEDLEVLNLSMCSGVSCLGVKALVNGCKKLKKLNLAWTYLNKQSLLEVTTRCPNLTHLNLSGCRDGLTDDVVLQLVDHCQHLTHLDLSDGVQITAESLTAISKNLLLQHLSISRCYNIQPQAFRICREMKSLTKLDVYGLLNDDGIELLKTELPDIHLNCSLFSTIARPVAYKYSGQIWGVRCSK